MWEGASIAVDIYQHLFWLDDVYTHQYTANIPSVTAGTEQSQAGTASIMLLMMGRTG